MKRQPHNPINPPTSSPAPLKPERAGLAAFVRSFGFAAAGLTYLVRTQRNARVHLVAAAAISVTAAWLRLPAAHWAILLLAFALVISLEAINTAVEATVDLASPEFAALAKVAKDVGAAAVLIAAIFCVGIGLLLLGPPLLAKFGWVQ